jgi:hypothetical protein
MKNNLKVLFFICSIPLFSLLMSCGNDEDENPQQDLIVGTWNYSSFDYDATINGQNFITFLVENFGISETEAGIFANVFLENADLVPSSITFNADGTYVLRDGSSEETGTYSLQNNESQLTLAPEDGDPIIFAVSELTNNTLTLESSQEEMQDINSDGVDEDIEIFFQISFVK